MKKWTQEMERYLKANYKNISDSRIAQKINLKYGTNFSISAIKSKREKLGLKIGYKRPLKYDDEVIEFILKNYKGNDNLELAKYIEESDSLEIELQHYKNIVKFFMKRENKLQRIETMFKNKDVDLSELSKLVNEVK